MVNHNSSLGEWIIATAHIGPARDCQYLGEQVGEIKIECRNAKVAAVHACEINERCLPSYKPKDTEAWRDRRPESDIYTLCRECPLYPPTLTTKAAPLPSDSL